MPWNAKPLALPSLRVSGVQSTTESASLAELGKISGVGQAKLARYGDAFLGVLKDAAHSDK